MNQLPIEMSANKISRGYYENKPFTHPDTYRMFRSPTFQFEETKDPEEQLEIQDVLIRNQIETAILDYCGGRFTRESDSFVLSCQIMKIVKKGYGV